MEVQESFGLVVVGSLNQQFAGKYRENILIKCKDEIAENFPIFS
jgi:hypothetical protein